MRLDLKSVSIAAAGVTAGAVTIAGMAEWYWNCQTTCAVRLLHRCDSTAAHGVYSPSCLNGLPEPVARYFEYAVVPGQPLTRYAAVSQEGEFRSSASAPWSPFTADQHYTTEPPGFVWNARLRLGPLPIRIRDSYIAGIARMQAKVASLLRLADAHDSRELNEGALHRYLAEAVWFPTALLPSRRLTWTKSGSAAAMATLTDGDSTVSLEFRFGTHGEVISTHAPARYREVRGEFVPTPWECTYHNYTKHQGMAVPGAAEAAWLLPEGRLTYWRGRVEPIALHTVTSG